MADAIRKFQQLLRELFQFDCADLDFGIYRIMNYKRDVIEEFITEKLPGVVEGVLKSGAVEQQDRANTALDEARQAVIDTLGSVALSVNGDLDPSYQDTPVGQAYLQAKAAAEGSRSLAAVEISIYNHLYTFFSRYYQDGDFISKRRYGRQQRYAIPYNGEEVYLHWANSDQYYIKTGKYFRDYDWKAPNGVVVHFRLKTADVEQNNVKGEDRFFLPQVKEIKWDADTRVITIPFEYRPLTETEVKNYGKQKQDKIIAEALCAIPKRLNKISDASAALKGEHRRNSKGKPVSHLEHHLRKYTWRNTSDFFIHKNLAEFLSRELDFYLKSEVLNLDEVIAAGEDVAEGWFQQLQLIKFVGDQVIEFLAQMENFQKMLWEKRKFVTETHYCITLDNIDTSFYADIVANDAQWDEWQVLFDIDGSKRSNAFLQAHPMLVLDTKYFGHDFTDQLLARFDDIDGMTNGLLVQSESWQALNLLMERYWEQIQCVYIDPLYNTGEDGFPYKDNYQHSTWLSMMDNLMLPWRRLLRDSGFWISHIDEHEFNALDRLIDMRFGTEQNVGPIIWDKRNPKGDATAIASQHEYICWAVKDYHVLKGDKQCLSRIKENGQTILRKADELIRLHGGVTTKTKKAFRTWVKKQNFSGGEEAYCELDKDGEVYQSVSMAWPNKKQAPTEYFQPLIHPIENKPCPVPARGWRNPPDTMKDLLEKDLILFGPDASTQPRRKYLLRDNFTENVPSLYYFGGSADSLQKSMGYHFPNPKPVRLGE